MSKSVSMSLRVDENIKNKADTLFKKLGLNTSSAINMFLTQCVRNQALPFTPSLNCEPSKELKNAIKEGEKILNGKSKVKKYDNVDDLLKDLDED